MEKRPRKTLGERDAEAAADARRAEEEGPVLRAGKAKVRPETGKRRRVTKAKGN